MKTILLYFFFIAISFSLSGQNYDFKDTHGNVVSWDTIHFSGDTSQTEILADLVVRNNTALPCSLKLKRILLDVVPGTANQICWAGTCWSVSTSVSPTYQIIAANSETSGGANFVGHYKIYHHFGSSLIMYVAYNNSNPNDSVAVVVSYDVPNPAGIFVTAGNERGISAPLPNPADAYTKFNYNMEPGAAGSVTIYSLTGTSVKKIDLKDSSGVVRISTADLPEGIYFYSFTVNGVRIKTNKLVVNH